MIVEKSDQQDWKGANSNVNADGKGSAHAGIATETIGRSDNAELYMDDVLGRISKAHEDDIYKRGGEKRTKHKEDE